MPTSPSANMGIVMPIPSSPGTDPGPGFATTINTALQTTVDQHNHTSGKGLPIPTAALNINADVPFGGFNILNCGTVNAAALSATSIGAATMTGDLAFGGHNLTGVGAISGLSSLTLTTLTATNIAGFTLTGAIAAGVQNLGGTNWSITGATGAASFSGLITATGGMTAAGTITANGTLTANSTVNLGTAVAGFTMTGTLALGANNITQTSGNITSTTGTLTVLNAAITNLTANLSIGNNTISGGATSALTVQTITANGNATVTGTLTQTGVATFTAPPIFNNLTVSTANAARAIMTDAGAGAACKTWTTQYQQYTGISFGTLAAGNIGTVASQTMTGAAVGDFFLVSVVSTSTSNLLTVASGPNTGYTAWAVCTATNTIAIFLASAAGGVFTSCTVNVMRFPQ